MELVGASVARASHSRCKPAQRESKGTRSAASDTLVSAECPVMLTSATSREIEGRDAVRCDLTRSRVRTRGERIEGRAYARATRVENGGGGAHRCRVPRHRSA